MEPPPQLLLLLVVWNIKLKNQIRIYNWFLGLVGLVASTLFMLILGSEVLFKVI